MFIIKRDMHTPLAYRMQQRAKKIRPRGRAVDSWDRPPDAKADAATFGVAITRFMYVRIRGRSGQPMYPMRSKGPLGITGRRQPSITEAIRFRRGLFASLGGWWKGATMLQAFTVYEHLSGVKLRASVCENNELITNASEHGLTRVKTT